MKMAKWFQTLKINHVFMIRKKVIIIFITLYSVTIADIVAQDESLPVTAKGYLSSMQSVIFEDSKGDWINDNLLHNRLNFRFYAGPSVTFALEVRNRLFTGDMIRVNTDYSDLMNSDRGWIDMTWNLIDENSVLFNTTIDRLWFDLSGDNYQVRIGRQRINWGQTFVWNPNDIFNTYSYFDFDYVERSGSDAVRLQFFPSYSSAIELAVKVDSEENITAAGLFRFNSWGYDIQFLGGYVNSEDLVAGAGWSGAFGSTSFRGEISWFQPASNFADTTGTGIFTIGFDRSFSSNSMLQFQVMYCNNPVGFADFDSFYTGNLSAKDLAFSEFSLFAAATIPATPLFSIGMSGIYYPGLKGFFAGPTIDISLAENVDFSFIWQYFNAESGDEKVKMTLGFLRFRYSF